jgi:hypothetical protein
MDFARFVIKKMDIIFFVNFIFCRTRIMLNEERFTECERFFNPTQEYLGFSEVIDRKRTLN